MQLQCCISYFGFVCIFEKMSNSGLMFNIRYRRWPSYMKNIVLAAFDIDLSSTLIMQPMA
jgi:hypothetical protein